MNTRRICWGLLYDTERGTVEMPTPKIEKAKFLLADPMLDYGCSKIEFAFLEQYRGNQQYWSLVMPPLRAVLGATDALLKGGRRKWAGPSLRHEGAEEVFRDFWEATDLARLLISDEKNGRPASQVR